MYIVEIGPDLFYNIKCSFVLYFHVLFSYFQPLRGILLLQGPTSNHFGHPLPLLNIIQPKISLKTNVKKHILWYNCLGLIFMLRLYVLVMSYKEDNHFFLKNLHDKFQKPITVKSSNIFIEILLYLSLNVRVIFSPFIYLYICYLSAHSCFPAKF